MSRRKLVLLASFLVAATSALPAQAYYWGYSPYTGGANWHWIARSFGYPLSRLSTAATPLYLLNPLIYNASYAVVGGSKVARRQKQFEDYQKQAQQFQQQQQAQYFQQGQPYSDPEPFAYPRQRTRPFVPNPYPVDQVAYAPWITGGPDPIWSGPDPVNEGGPFNVLGAPPPVVPTAGGQMNGFDPPLAATAAQTPQPEPEFAGAPSEAESGGSGASPFAAAFIELVRTKFKGNMARALNDKQARSLARTLGVIPEGKFDPDEIPLERLALIEKVLADEKESPATRLSTVRLLLKH
jgi:hypothetical protein